MPSRRRRERSFRTRAEAQDWAADYRRLRPSTAADRAMARCSSTSRYGSGVV